MTLGECFAGSPNTHLSICLVCRFFSTSVRLFGGNKEKMLELQDRIVTVENVAGINLPRIHRVECDIANLQQTVATLLHNQKPIAGGSATETQPSITAEMARDAPMWREAPAPALPPATHRGPGALPKREWAGSTPSLGLDLRRHRQPAAGIPYRLCYLRRCQRRLRAAGTSLRRCLQLSI